MSKQPVKVFDTKFESIAEAHRNLHAFVGQDMLDSDDISYGAVYYRVLADDIRWAAYQIDGPRRPRKVRCTKRMWVIVRGNRFLSIRQAAEYFGVSSATISYYLYSHAHPDCYLEPRRLVA